ncbi:hypothetical protein CDAR_428321 [Caerostris darwini]|uniref:Uncharacterized protein n=1 Tax=Caerostris darwini TaxID=1538125 RepID=A0AAV4PHW0_9ARAC|nr:hypothetical protein CDAR_428321 [Caerostris darwini]
MFKHGVGWIEVEGAAEQGGGSVACDGVAGLNLTFLGRGFIELSNSKYFCVGFTGWMLHDIRWSGSWVLSRGTVVEIGLSVRMSLGLGINIMPWLLGGFKPLSCKFGSKEGKDAELITEQDTDYRTQLELMARNEGGRSLKSWVL